MNILRRFTGALLSRVPDPGRPGSHPGPVDPRVAPEALARFGQAELGDFGMAASPAGRVVPGRQGDRFTRSLERSVHAHRADARALREGI